MAKSFVRVSISNEIISLCSSDEEENNAHNNAGTADERVERRGIAGESNEPDKDATAAAATVDDGTNTGQSQPKSIESNENTGHSKSKSVDLDENESNDSQASDDDECADSADNDDANTGRDNFSDPDDSQASDDDDDETATVAARIIKIIGQQDYDRSQKIIAEISFTLRL